MKLIKIKDRSLFSFTYPNANNLNVEITSAPKSQLFRFYVNFLRDGRPRCRNATDIIADPRNGIAIYTEIKRHSDPVAADHE